MKSGNRRNLIINTTQLLVWVGVFLIPALVTGTMTGSVDQAMKVFLAGAMLLLPAFVIYGLNYYLLVPKLLHGGRAGWFYLINGTIIGGWLLVDFLFKRPVEFPPEVVEQFGQRGVRTMYVGSIIARVFIQCLLILLAVGLRHIMRANETVVAELSWLKAQLNPHFLFNTLNNISSLTQIDPDKAQESIGQLSDLLRYALYDSEAEKVPLAAEVEFMDNYVDLMALRCNELTTVTKDLQVPQGHVEVAPLLFISLIENAFKHGINARYPSFVKVSMRMEGEQLLFRCENSLFEKQGSDHIGSGIGLENMKRRLELLYPGRYTYSQQSDTDTYRVEVTIHI
ncbi:MAG: histidine kinase [Bacteroidales bacterium]|nr:histidine kinase [Bacteroidales bacterium]